MDFERFFALVPREGWAVLVAPLGWVLALVLRWLITAFLNLVRFDRLADRVGFSAFLAAGQVSYTASRLAGIAGFWLTLLATLVTVSALLDPNLVSSVFERLAQWAPALVAAVLVVVIGLLVVSFLANLVLTLARSAAWPQARLVSRGVRVLGIVVVVAVATEQLGLNLSLVHSLVLIVAGGLALGLALAFGLGGQDLARQALKRWTSALAERDRPRGPDLEG